MVCKLGLVLRVQQKYHITNSLYDNVMSARIAARDLAAMLWMPHVMSRLCMLHVMLMLWMRLLGLRVGRHDAETKIMYRVCKHAIDTIGV